MASIKGIVVEIGGDTSGLQQALQKAKSSTNSLTKELSGINSLLKLDTSDIDLAGQKQQVLKEAIQETSKYIEELQNSYNEVNQYMDENGSLSEENEKKYRSLQREIALYQNKLKNLEQELELSSKQTLLNGQRLEEYGKTISNISTKINNLGSNLTKTLTLPIVALGTATVNSAKNFETAWTGVQKTVEGTAQQMEALKTGIKNMSEELPSTTTEISAVAESAGQLGIQTDNILEFTKVMIDLGNSTNLSAEEASSALAKFANVTQMSADNYDRLGSTIVDLGNNFATTEADIVEMATRLASTGEIAGLSQSQILALATSLSSVGIEAEAGGSAMSKLLKIIQVAVETGNEDLQNFADVAGMTSEQFKTAFEENAVKALSAFISGLNDTERNGKTAIVTLEEMGLTEVRLSNSILSLANASNVMASAVETADKAWSENTALTNEANKRYQTLDSRLAMLGNKLNNVAIEVGEKLTPFINELMDGIEGLIDKFGKMSASELETIIKTTALVASIGPAIKIIGVLGTGIGSTVKIAGNFTQAIALMGKTSTTAFKNASTGVQTLSKSLTFMTSSAGIALIAITALVTAIAILATHEAEQAKASKEMTESWNDLKEAGQDAVDASMSQISVIEKLKNELMQITDENGRVKEGYELRAKYILGELNNALGTEYTMNNNIISQYSELKNGIDELISAKKAEALLNSYEDSYAEAISKRSEAQKELNNLYEKQYEYQENMKNGTFGIMQAKELYDITNQIEEQQKMLGEYAYTIEQYEQLQTASVSGSAEEINKAVENMAISYSEATETITGSIEEQIEQEAIKNQMLSQYLIDYDDTLTEYSKKEIETQKSKNEEVLKNLAEQLVSQTSAVDELSLEQINAWRNLATGSRTAYSEALSGLDEETRKKIELATGVVATDTSLEIELASLATRATDEFDKNADGVQSGSNFLDGIISGISDMSKQEGILGIVGKMGVSMINALNTSLGIHSPSREAMKSAKYFLEGFYVGIKENEFMAVNSVSQFGDDIKDELNNSINFANEFSSLQSGLNSKIETSSKFISPAITFNVQKMDEENLNACFAFVNRKFGSQY